LIGSFSMNVRRSLSVLACCVLALVLVSCATSQPKQLTILQTNDFHASFLPHEAGWVQSDPKPLVGGYLSIAHLVDSLRKAKPAVLFLDAGDVMTGSPISEYDYQGAKGGGLFVMMNTLGYDAWTIGNHDLDISQDNLQKLTAIAKFPIVSANLVDTAGRFPFHNKEYVIVERGGLRIGILGLMSSELFRLTNTNNLQGLKVLPPVATAQRVIDILDPQTDLIIALTHQGVDEDSVLAANTHGLDVIIGGHSHTRLKRPKLVQGVVICQAGSNGENLGQLDITVDHDSVTSYDGRLITPWAVDRHETSELATLVKEFSEKVNAEYGEVIGTLSMDWKRTGASESAIGGFVADALREGSGADIAVTNSSGIRKDLQAGPVKKLDLFEISPFRNYLSTFPLQGSAIRELLQRHVATLADGKSPIQFSGVTCTWKRKDGKGVLETAKVGGVDLDDAKTYTFGTSDFVVDQADKYLGFTPTGVTSTRTTIFEALIAKVLKEKQLSAPASVRFTEDH
jgi:2',3'-cyclic-nucleotide 2'-phosphodiesterase (5'-nucleotidase family)